MTADVNQLSDSNQSSQSDQPAQVTADVDQLADSNQSSHSDQPAHASHSIQGNQSEQSDGFYQAAQQSTFDLTQQGNIKHLCGQSGFFNKYDS